MGAVTRKRESKRPATIHISHIRLLSGITLAMIVTVVLIMSLNPGTARQERAVLAGAMLSEGTELNIDSSGIASRIIEENFQIHMQEADQESGEIPYVEVWVLNDPFYPLMGELGSLRSAEGTLSGKEWQMLGFPDYTQDTGGSTGTSAASQASSAATVTTSASENVVVVESIYEVRGIRYAIIKVNDTSYDRLKTGSAFAEVFKVQEIRDNQTVLVLCGDETYELKVNQLRKI
ncbi:MAG: hypothetical protein A2Y75_05515 [Candidatus Solincola sediminis]|uniref:Uncharacterized protein n=1 Tax=Candidatus Solincola sediminis TaxID=1797199 RepID=A0A1F2WFL3_9ACTN|nr:MAG: hypothetical protein A2Y75_05515 [Candidatus Solincola sediminis]